MLCERVSVRIPMEIDEFAVCYILLLDRCRHAMMRAINASLGIHATFIHSLVCERASNYRSCWFHIEHHGNNHRQIFDTCSHNTPQIPFDQLFTLPKSFPQIKRLLIYSFSSPCFFFCCCSLSFHHKFRWSRMKKYFYIFFFFNQNNE